MHADAKKKHFWACLLCFHPCRQSVRPPTATRNRKTSARTMGRLYGNRLGLPRPPKPKMATAATLPLTFVGDSGVGWF